ncbi:MAG: DNA-directed RNA polymerase subunit alpha C-terminal domain-containing protein [Dehalococcoidia bacterium]
MPDTAVGAAWGDDDEPHRQFGHVPIEDLNLSMRAYNCLRRSGVTTVGQIMKLSPDDLLAFRNFGMKSLREVWDRLLDLTAPPESPHT